MEIPRRSLVDSAVEVGFVHRTNCIHCVAAHLALALPRRTPARRGSSRRGVGAQPRPGNQCVRGCVIATRSPRPSESRTVRGVEVRPSGHLPGGRRPQWLGCPISRTSSASPAPRPWAGPQRLSDLVRERRTPDSDQDEEAPLSRPHSAPSRERCSVAEPKTGPDPGHRRPSASPLSS